MAVEGIPEVPGAATIASNEVAGGSFGPATVSPKERAADDQRPTRAAAVGARRGSTTGTCD